MWSLKAHEECQILITTIRDERNELHFHRLFTRASSLLKDTYGEDQEPEIPPATAGKRHSRKANAPATTPGEYYRVNYYYPFVDHVTLHLQSRFLDDIKGAMLAYYLLPKKLAKLTSDIEEAVKKEFLKDLAMPSSFESEVLRWKTKFLVLDTDDLELLAIINSTDKNLYPNIYAILSLLLTLPVNSCTCERSFSALRRLKT